MCPQPGIGSSENSIFINSVLDEIFHCIASFKSRFFNYELSIIFLLSAFRYFMEGYHSACVVIANGNT